MVFIICISTTHMYPSSSILVSNVRLIVGCVLFSSFYLLILISHLHFTDDDRYKIIKIKTSLLSRHKISMIARNHLTMNLKQRDAALEINLKHFGSKKKKTTTKTSRENSKWPIETGWYRLNAFRIRRTPIGLCADSNLMLWSFWLLCALLYDQPCVANGRANCGHQEMILI